MQSDKNQCTRVSMQAIAHCQFVIHTKIQMNIDAFQLILFVEMNNSTYDPRLTHSARKHQSRRQIFFFF